MRELSLFTGAGGGVYGSKILGWKTLGYVEWEKHPQRIIEQRIKDGVFDQAPIFTDVREFAQSGAARQYRGFVDVVTGGFPCQPFSVAGKRKASDDERNMWPATMEVIKAVEPPVVYLENVPGLLSATVDDGAGRSIHYFGEILRDLAQIGYDVKWCVLGAGDVGGIHRRARLWILAYAKCERIQRGVKEEVSRIVRLSRNQGCGVAEKHLSLPSIRKPLLRGANDGVAHLGHRLKAAGNGQFPISMAAAYEILSKGFIK